MIALLVWWCMCHELQLKEQLIPCDVMMHWNSTYDMLKFALAYRVVIDHITADKHLKLRRYKLDNDDWAIVKELVSVLGVCMLVSFHIHRLLMHFNIQKYKNATLFFL